MYQCPNCGGQLRFDITSQQLACVQCSSLFDSYDITKEKDAEEEQYYDVTVFKCPQCGGEIISSDNRASDFCSFCGASTVLTSNLRKEKRPQYIIPFTKTKDDCKKAYSKFMRHAWFAPKELKDSRYIDGFRGIYMPYWAYHISEKGPVSLAGSHSYRRGDYVYTDHYSLTGTVNSSYKGISYDASSSFDDNLSASIAPFDVKNMNRFTPSYLSGFYADTADVDASEYELEAKHIAASQTYNYIKRMPLPSSAKFSLDESESSVESKLNPQCEKADGAMFPVWFLSYRNKDRVAYATVNGQTGKVVADMPVSIGKYLISSLILAIPIFLMLNAIFTMLPSTSLGICSIIASLIPFLFTSELKQIIIKDSSDFETSSDPKKQYSKKRKKKTSVVTFLSTGITVVAYIIIILTFMVTLSSTSIFSYITYAAGIIGLIGFFYSRKPFKTVTGKNVPDTLYPMITIIISCIVQFLKPVSDVFYYACIILNLVAVLINLVGLIRYYNILATRKLPQFDTHKGGDDRA